MVTPATASADAPPFQRIMSALADPRVCSECGAMVNGADGEAIHREWHDDLRLFLLLIPGVQPLDPASDPTP